MKETESGNSRVVIIGGGPAGLTAAYELSKQGLKSVVLEKDPVLGGLARTVNYKGYLFDIGGHRFFTKVHAVERLWREILGDDFIRRERLSRIYYNKKFFYYPLKPWNALFGLGIWNSILILVSYVSARLNVHPKNETFEDWVSHHFGKRLYRIFFKTYTEKVWGIPCSEIRAEWAAQRIKGLSLISVIKNTLLKNSGKNGVIKTLIDSFDYPRYGPGMMWQKVAEVSQERGSEIHLDSSVQKIHWKEGQVESVAVCNGHSSNKVEGSHFISSMPIRELVQKLEPPAPQEVVDAAGALNYRDFITVALIVNQKELFPDNWIYIHDPDVKVGRIQNFKNWSPDMVPDDGKTCLGLEYFCFEGDGLWNMSDSDLVTLGKQELHHLGLVDMKNVEDGTVVRMPKAYPVYDSTYRNNLEIVRNFLDSLGNLQVVGRNGMHKYNNQDHSMLTAMLAARNIAGGQYDLWAVNVDPDYHEEVSGSETDEFALLASQQPKVPERIITPGLVDEVIVRGLARMNKLAFAIAVGTVAGCAIFVATIWLILRGGPGPGPNLNLLNQYFLGYTITLQGAFIGFGYTFGWGFLFGWGFAYLRNFLIALFLYYVKEEAEASSFRNVLDYI